MPSYQIRRKPILNKENQAKEVIENAINGYALAVVNGKVVTCCTKC